MDKLYRVLILLGIFLGLGISCASAANVVSFDPQTVEMYPGSSQNVKIVMDEVPDGLAGFNITISILDPEIAEITAVSFPSWGVLPRNSALPSSSVWIKVSDLDDQVVSGDTNVLLGTITVTGKKAGTTDLGIPTTKISADGGSLITPVVNTGKINVLDNEDPVTPDNLPPSSITNLQSTKGTTWIKWTWQNPTDTDFDHTEVYLNGAYQTETSAEYFNATGLESETSYTIGTRTVDINENINETWINQTVITEKEFVPEIKLPVADFTTNVSEGYVPLSVQFNDSSENAVSFNWDFGDVTYSTEKNPIHTYSIAGFYTVNLTVTNENGTDSKLATINVSEKSVSILPVANFTANVSEGYAPLSVQFNDSSENAVSFDWDFGDGANSTEKNPIHTYFTAGIYAVNLTVSNGNDTDSKLATINVSETSVSVLPVANFTTNVSEGYAPLSVQFNDSSENAVSFDWDFGDGANSTEKDPIHTYSNAGIYTINLTVSNGNDTDSKLATINVSEKTVPDDNDTDEGDGTDNDSDNGAGDGTDNDSDNGAGDGTDEVCEETTPVCEETTPVCKPVCEETTPVCKPVCTEIKPVCKPICTETKPVCKPVCAETKPVCTETKPVCAETKPVCTETKPVCTETKPVCAETKPVCVETKPVCVETKPVCTETKEALEAEKSCEVKETPAKITEELKKQEEIPEELKKQEECSEELNKQEKIPEEVKKQEECSEELKKQEEIPEELKKQEEVPEELKKQEECSEELKKQEEIPEEVKAQEEIPEEVKTQEESSED